MDMDTNNQVNQDPTEDMEVSEITGTDFVNMMTDLESDGNHRDMSQDDSQEQESDDEDEEEDSSAPPSSPVTSDILRPSRRPIPNSFNFLLHKNNKVTLLPPSSSYPWVTNNSINRNMSVGEFQNQNEQQQYQPDQPQPSTSNGNNPKALAHLVEDLRISTEGQNPYEIFGTNEQMYLTESTTPSGESAQGAQAICGNVFEVTSSFHSPSQPTTIQETGQKNTSKTVEFIYKSFLSQKKKS